MAETQSEKLHTACDECRTRKLKCSGESPRCSRCERESIQCVYSPQKQMGRPRKRRREDGGATAETRPENGKEPTLTSFVAPHFGDFDLVSLPDLSAFSGFSDYQSSAAMSNALVPTIQADTSLENGYGFSQPLDFSIDSSIDPLLWDVQPSGAKENGATAQAPPNTGAGPCTCLSIMYLTLTDLQSMTSFAFPDVVPSLREAMKTASSIIQCEKCPKDPFTTIQNVQSLSALLSAISERFHRVLKDIDAEAERLELSGQKKPFRIGDNNPALQHLHTGTVDCPMSFNVELEPKEWKRLAKKALKTEVVGGGSNPQPLSALVDQMEQRQRNWHKDTSMQAEELTRLFGGRHNTCASKGDDATCLRMLNQIRVMMNHMAWE